MTLTSGTKLGRYEIRSQLGAGGMGEVYLAEDTRLHRKVALKVLPVELTQNKDRLRRFEQEAQAASALNHPNIITIYEIEQIESLNFIATEFIDGETLRKRMKGAPMKLGEALDVAAQIASALSAAHAAGIVHRDIKPENIMVRRDGIVKVLDFGLAKLTERLPLDSVDPEALTRAVVKTDPSVVMGTAIYMSPEQARGISVDARTDIFSLGIVLYEMVAGRLPFEGVTSSEVLAAILGEKEPQPLARYSREVPAELERIVSKALRKNREQRYQTILDLLLDLKSLKQESEFAAKLERSKAPDSTTSEAQAKDEERATIATAPMPAGRSTLSAAQFVTRMKEHKLARILPLVLSTAALATLIYFGNAYFKASGPITSLAVLPLANASNDPNTEYLSDGVTESIINSLSKLPNLRVMARTTVFRYKGKEADAQKVGRELGVGAVLTGKVLQLGDALIIQADLVNVADGSELWGEQYNRKLSDILVVQDEIAKQISERLRLRLTGEDEQRLTKRYTGNTEAYQLYLQGRYYLDNSEGLDETKKALNFFERAIATDPHYALGYAGVADAYISLGQPWSGGLPPKEALREAKGAATKALEIDDTLSEAHSSLAHVTELYDWDWIGAEREYKRSLELNPNNTTSHVWYSEYLQAVGRNTEAMAEIRRAVELDPLNNFIKAQIGYVFYTARQYDQAIEQFQKAGDHGGLAWAYEEKKMYNEAIAELQKAISLGRTDFAVASLAYGYAVSGKKSEAQKVLAELKERSKQRYVSPFFIANIYIGLGDKDQAFAWLEKAYEDDDQWMIWLKSYPQMDGLRSDPRFADLVRRVGLPQ